MRAPLSLSAYLDNAPEWAKRAAIALSAAAALTDELAQFLVRDCVPERIEANKFIELFKLCDFVVERNSEWHIEFDSRSWLVSQLANESCFYREVNKNIIEFSERGDIECVGESVPVYLFTELGRAYYEAAEKQEESLELYSALARTEYSGVSWLAGILAEEQQALKILPEKAIEPQFLRGLTLYREADFVGAEKAFSRVVRAAEVRVEVAIAWHFLGVISARARNSKAALDRLDKGVSLFETLGEWRGLAMVLNSRGGVKRDRNDLDGALADLDRAAELSAELGDRRGLAMVLTSRGGVKRDRNDLDGAIRDVERVQDLAKSGVPDINSSSVRNRLKNLRNIRNKIANAPSDTVRQEIWRKQQIALAKGLITKSVDPLHSVSILRSIIKFENDASIRGECYHLIGKAYFKIKLMQQAIENFKQSLNEGFDKSDVRASLAYAFFLEGANLSITRDNFERALSLNPDNAWAWSWYGLALSREGVHDQAELHGRLALEIKSFETNISLMTNLAKILLQTGDARKRSEAIDVLKRAREHAPPGFDWPRRMLSELVSDPGEP